MDKTAALILQHLVDEHGHDDLDDNPSMAQWSLADFQAQHEEQHDDDDDEIGHVH